MINQGRISTEKINVRYLYGILLILLLVGGFGILKRCVIAHKGIYTVATIYKVSVGRSGATVYINYKYKGKEYNGGFASGFSFDKTIGRKIFIQILPDSPSNFNFFDLTVPDCILNTNKDMEWERIPICK